KKKKEMELSAKQKEEQLKREAKEFSRNMGKMIRIKQELLAELAKAKEREKKKAEEAQKAKERKELDDITRMIKEAAKKSKK
ncbi:MAG: hypothetical protein ACTSQJ_17030, partial [Promethearchaeota archaeon]